MKESKGEQGLLGEVFRHRRPLGVSFVLVFMFTLVGLNALGLTPELPSDERDVVVQSETPRTDNVYAAVRTTEEPSLYEGKRVAPLRVVIDSVGIDARVITPLSKDIAVLDSALLRGAVHYPGSGTLAEDSNMFIFGHSSHLPVVNNKNFQAFNDLERVKPGALVQVESVDVVNIYRVTSVEKVATSEALVQIGGDRKMLTLSTCNSFGKPTDRYVVKAEFVRAEVL